LERPGKLLIDEDLRRVMREATRGRAPGERQASLSLRE
jgi:hypothetical protein